MDINSSTTILVNNSMPNYIHIYKDRNFHLTLEDDSNLAQVIENILVTEPGTWIMFQDSDSPEPKPSFNIPEIFPTFEEIELTAAGRELLTTLCHQGVDMITYTHTPDNT